MVRNRLSIVLLPLLLIALLLSTVGGCQRSTEQGLSDWAGGVKVRTLYGKVEGKVSGEEIVAWKGIPYAKPPVDDLRWKAPRDPDPWKRTLKAFDFGSEATQYGITGSLKGSEDCLYLNIWRPCVRRG